MPGAALAYPAWPIRRFPHDNRLISASETLKRFDGDHNSLAKRFDGDHNSVTS
ncbi:hypothetical protein SeGA_5225 [Salmonella enterica subsp. enterica serovar Gaminara str. A4-567]|nr:hypothetical protein SeGA_5225 [Salmonella enterica subsp. enterica serovar Gaminara str. A4-567]